MSETGSSLPSVARLEEAMEAGHRAMRLERWKDAMGFFRMSTELKPLYVEAWLGLAMALRRSGNLRGAVDSYRRSLDIDFSNRDAWTGLIEVLHELGMYKQEIEACDCFLRFNSRADGALLNKGVALHSLGKMEAALDCFTQAADRRPDNVAALNNKGAVLLRLGRLEEALEAFDWALTFEPHHDDVLRNRCLLLIRLGRYSEAVRAAEQMLAVKEEGWLWMLKGLAHAELREVPLALQSLERARELDSNLEGLEEALERTRKLKATMEEAERRLPDGVSEQRKGAETPVADQLQIPPQGIAVVLLHLGYPTEALRIWQQSMDKDCPDDWLGLGKALMAGGERQAGERCLSEAAKRAWEDGNATEFPTDELPSLWREISKHVSEERKNEAMDLLSRALEYRGDLEHGWEWLGVLRALDGQLVASEAALRQATDVEPDYATAWSNLGAVLISQCKLNEASNALRTALVIDPNHAEALNNLGLVELRLDNCTEARESLRRAIKIKEHPQTWLILAAVMEKMNRWREAEHCYEKILALDPKNAMAVAGLARTRGKIGSRTKAMIDKGSRRLMHIRGVGPSRARALAKAGYTSPKAIVEAPLADISTLPGFNKSVAAEIRKTARQLLMKRNPRRSPGR
jgi:tetratricopeptide (TPR) repeat protein